MFIESLEEMEKLLSRKVLHWDGWTVIQTFDSEEGDLPDWLEGKRYSGKFKRLEPTGKGWEIPSKIVVNSKGKRES